MDARPAVRARGITKCFGDVVALDGVDVDVAPGRVHGLAGPTGAGKTTLLGLLLGLDVADGGSLEVLGAPVGRVHSGPGGVAGFVDGPGLYPSLTAWQNLAALARLRGGGRRTARVEEVLEEVGLAEVCDARVRGFSLGMRQRLGLAAALLGAPRLLVLDEPSNGLDPAGTRHVGDVVTRLAAGGTSVLLSSHHMGELEALCSQVTILAAGRVVFSGPTAALASQTPVSAHRLRTSDQREARRLAGAVAGVRIVEDVTVPPSDGACVVHAPVAVLDRLVVRLVESGVAVRELAPVVPPLEAAFLALTQSGEDAR
jgi:ABC-2 type transport system ATP-binding protein